MKDVEISMRLLIVVWCILLGFLVGCGEVCDAPTYPDDVARGETEAARVKVFTRFSRNYASGIMLTVEHDGHLWVVYYGQTFQHSPSCPCLKKSKIEIEDP